MQTPALLPVTGGAQGKSGGFSLSLAVAEGITLVVAAAFFCRAARRTR